MIDLLLTYAGVARSSTLIFGPLLLLFVASKARRGNADNLRLNDDVDALARDDCQGRSKTRPSAPGWVQANVATMAWDQQASNASNSSCGGRSSRTILGRALSSFSTASRCSAVWAAGRCPWGSSRAAARWCSRSSRAARVSGSRRSRPARRVTWVIVRWRAISVPWSQVIERSNAGGRSAMPGPQRLVQGVAVSAGEVQQPDQPGLPLDERADRRALVLADDQIAFPVPGSERSSGGKGRWWIVSIGCSNRGRRRSVRC